MRVIFVLFDTLNRHYLQCYGGTEVETPNFNRLAERCVTFDRHYVGSMPCMPARRDLQTGRLNFMHRSWGPMEPFDVSMIQVLQKAEVYSHIITDHVHYLEDGGAGYCTKFSSSEMVRGQEGDLWKAQLDAPMERWRETYHPNQFISGAWDKVAGTGGTRSKRYHDMVNRDYLSEEEDFPSAQCFRLVCEFLDTNKDADNWFLQLETFDPHEPFAVPERLRRKYAKNPDGKIRDWPPYERVTEDADEGDEMRAAYKALLAFCDEHLGRLLDKMDALDMWKDTMLVVSTDHGYLLGEHDWWAKLRMPIYQEIGHIPLFVHHPDHADQAGQRRSALTQTPDLMPTFLESFGCEVPAPVRAASLLPCLSDASATLHDVVLFGYYGGAIHATDGHHVYFRYPPDMVDQTLYQYTLMPSHLKGSFSLEELAGAEMVRDLDWANGYPVMRIPVVKESPWHKTHGLSRMVDHPTTLFDIVADPLQQTPVEDAELHRRFERSMCAAMKHQQAPPEAYARLDLTAP